MSGLILGFILGIAVAYLWVRWRSRRLRRMHFRLGQAIVVDIDRKERTITLDSAPIGRPVGRQHAIEDPDGTCFWCQMLRGNFGERIDGVITEIEP